ncbi:MAG: hypothetical protein A2864_01200 [Candidatus Woykebacteria bacterium RIFCSPHIGHO2_01_FULL_39_12]|uniref:50S ribosomal protein L7/L12 n=1 Tax=Candidatus Woykebacteria bacterium RIFCSPHIGHO2_01_FULL_39_12 TaxID=1802599 RepID=A0A1G1WIA8_9BACT|nr:MAG: hypothetical protein A2864_01200 [Candidatus Woykebacteria bacterium RIFCSPHIGHO2_01_FULL_39_12]
MSRKLDLLRQALSAAESSIKLARQLISDIEREDSDSGKKPPKEKPGIIGVFDGELMMTDKNETFPVPANYASKSLLVVGDTLKIIDEGGEKKFKQIEHVKRHKTTGILAKKDGKWRVVTPEGSYKVLTEAVQHFNGDVGDEVLLQLPANNLQVAYGTIETIQKKEQIIEEKTEATKKPENEEKKEPTKKLREEPKEEEKKKEPEGEKKEEPKSEEPEAQEPKASDEELV